MLKYLYLLIVAIIFAVASHSSAEVKLSTGEKALVEKLAQACNCRVTFAHDQRPVLTKMKNSGVFSIHLQYTSFQPFLCLEDTASRYAQKIATAASAVLSHKQYYQHISITFSAYKYANRYVRPTATNTEVPYCTNSFSFDATKLHLVYSKYPYYAQ